MSHLVFKLHFEAQFLAGLNFVLRFLVDLQLIMSNFIYSLDKVWNEASSFLSTTLKLNFQLGTILSSTFDWLLIWKHICKIQIWIKTIKTNNYLSNTLNLAPNWLPLFARLSD